MRKAIFFFNYSKGIFSCPFLKFPECAYQVLPTLRIPSKGEENAGTQNAQIILFPKSNIGNFLFLDLVLFHLRELCSVSFLPHTHPAANKLKIFYLLVSHLYISITYTLIQT